MDKIINESQSAFIHRKSIIDNIILCHDLYRSFNLNKGPAKMAPKIDLSKTFDREKNLFDRVKWNFLRSALRALNFSKTFINWIMQCVTSPAFSILVNENPCSFFNSTRACFSIFILHHHGISIGNAN